MMDALRSAIGSLLDDHPLDAAAMEFAVGSIMDGGCDPLLISAFLTALRCRGESVEQLVGAARAMRKRSLKIPCRQVGLLDTCGTGGDALHTFNISTATAFVAAATGVPVAKHGNRSASSKSGSADVLEALGVRLDLTPEQVAECVDEVGIGFCFAQRIHAAMKHAAPVRQALGFRTLFNLLGPLTNPAQAEFQLLGVGRIPLAELMAGALAQLGANHAIVVCGNGELDEVSLWGPTTVFDVRKGSVKRHEWTAETFGLPECRVADLTVESPTESAAVIRAVF
ncbi:MAG: anthranilate phosphoribosyltransferase, partial [Planctomycetales bacterium 12-60-4]